MNTPPFSSLAEKIAEEGWKAGWVGSVSIQVSAVHFGSVKVESTLGLEGRGVWSRYYPFLFTLWGSFLLCSVCPGSRRERRIQTGAWKPGLETVIMVLHYNKTLLILWILLFSIQHTQGHWTDFAVIFGLKRHYRKHLPYANVEVCLGWLLLDKLCCP